LRADRALFLTQSQVSCRHLAGFPSNEVPRAHIQSSEILFKTVRHPCDLTAASTTGL